MYLYLYLCRNYRIIKNFHEIVDFFEENQNNILNKKDNLKKNI